MARTQVSRECPEPPNRDSVDRRAHGLTFEEVVVLVVAGAHCAAEQRRGGSSGGIGGTRGRRCRANPSAELPPPDWAKNPSLRLRHFRQAPAPKGKYFRGWRPAPEPRLGFRRSAVSVFKFKFSPHPGGSEGKRALDAQLTTLLVASPSFLASPGVEAGYRGVRKPRPLGD